MLELILCQYQPVPISNVRDYLRILYMDPGMSMAKVSHVEDALVFCCPNDLQRSMPRGNESSNYILSGMPFFLNVVLLFGIPTFSLVGGLEHFVFLNIGKFIIPTDEHMFQGGMYTNQIQPV